MNIDLQPGRYVIAVSGGVDSVVLLDLLAGNPGLKLVVAHLDHGIREDSEEDRKLVATLAKKYKLPFVYDEAQLGAGASEAVARQARYDFLHTIRIKTASIALVTAHHQDDLIETALLNLLRGTGRKGLSSLQSTDVIKRPLLHVPKQELQNYAITHNLQWREDSTNSDIRYKRNFIRHKLVPKLTASQRQVLLDHIHHIHDLNMSIDTKLTDHLHVQPDILSIERSYFMLLPHDIATEFMAAWLRNNGVKNFDRKGLQRIVIASKTHKPGQRIDVNHEYYIEVGKHNLALKVRDR